MKRPVLLVSLALSFLVPALALAAFTRPSDVLFTLQSDGKPREFDTTFYAKTEGTEDNVRIFGKVSGMTEGKTLDELKLQMHADISVAADEGKGSAGVDLMVRGQTAYVRIGEVSLHLTDITQADAEEWLAAFNREFKGKWFIVPLTASELESYGGMSSGIIDEFTADSDVLTPADIRELATRVIDAAVQMEATRFREGNAYLLTLKPHFLLDAVKAARSFLGEKDPGLLQNGALDMDMQELEEIESQILRTLIVRLKVDTNNDDDFRFAKYFASVTVPEANVFFSVEGTMQHRSLPVYLDLPKNAEKLEDHLMDLDFPTFTTPVESPIFDDIPSWEPPVDTSSDPCRSRTIEGVSANRTGACPVVRESRRSLKERVLNNIQE